MLPDNFQTDNLVLDNDNLQEQLLQMGLVPEQVYDTVTGQVISIAEAYRLDPEAFQGFINQQAGGNVTSLGADAGGGVGTTATDVGKLPPSFWQKLTADPAKLIGMLASGGTAVAGVALAIKGLTDGTGKIKLPDGRQIQLSPQEQQLLDLAVQQAQGQASLSGLTIPSMRQALTDNPNALGGVFGAGLRTAATQAGTQEKLAGSVDRALFGGPPGAGAPIAAGTPGAIGPAAAAGAAPNMGAFRDVAMTPEYLNTFVPGFANAKETQGRNLSSRQFVEGLYTDVLNRTSLDDPGIAEWTRQIDAGEKTREQVAQGIVGSTEQAGQGENVETVLRELYGALTGRKGDAVASDEIQHWMSAVGISAPSAGAAAGAGAGTPGTPSPTDRLLQQDVANAGTLQQAQDQANRNLTGFLAEDASGIALDRPAEWLEKDLADKRMAFEAQMIRDLGPGWELSTPGMQAKMNFERQIEAVRGEDARSTAALRENLMAGRFGRAGSVAGATAGTNAIRNIFQTGQSGAPSPAGTVSTLISERPGQTSIPALQSLANIGNFEANQLLQQQAINAQTQTQRSTGTGQLGGTLVGLGVSPYLNLSRFRL